MLPSDNSIIHDIYSDNIQLPTKSSIFSTAPPGIYQDNLPNNFITRPRSVTEFNNSHAIKPHAAIDDDIAKHFPANLLDSPPGIRPVDSKTFETDSISLLNHAPPSTPLDTLLDTTSLMQFPINRYNAIVKLSISGRMIGAIIGVAGSSIRLLRKSSGAYIEVNERTGNTSRRVITIKGTVPQIVTALLSIAETIQITKPVNDNAQNSTISNQYFNNNPSAMKYTVVLLVPNVQVGCIIGKYGSQIDHTRKSTGCTIRISDEAATDTNDKTVSVHGSHKAVQDALLIMVTQLSALQNKFLLNDNMNISPPMQTANNLQHAPYVEKNSDFLYNNTTNLNNPPIIPANDPTQTVLIPLQNSQVGAVIGANGQTIAEIRRVSGAFIKVSTPVPQSPQRFVTIIGTRQCVETAVSLLCNYIQNSPQ